MPMGEKFMANKHIYNVDEDIIEILKRGYIENNVFYLTDANLDRKVYENVDKVLKCLGAKWDRRLKGHTFQYDISNSLDKVISERKVTDWKKQTDYFYTPKNVTKIMIGLIPESCYADLEILEPSCGQGHILEMLKENFKNAKITCIEKNPLHCSYLKKKGFQPICKDFLEVTPEEKYNVIVMNPPFSEELEHIKHAFEFLKDGGYLVSVSSGTFLYRNDDKHKKFLEWFKERDGSTYKLEKQSFKESGTLTNAILIFLEKENKERRN